VLAAAIAGSGLAAVLYAVVALDGSTTFPGSAALLPVLGTAAVVAGGANGASYGPVRLLGVRPAQLLGRLSYSWYLWHWPVLVLAPNVLDRTWPDPSDWSPCSAAQRSPR